MSAERMINPNYLLLVHMDNAGRPVLDLGDTVFYDRAFRHNFNNIDSYEKYLSSMYEYEFVSGDRIGERFVIYKITCVK